MEEIKKETELKDRVSEEAMRLFLKYGVKSVRMDDIATHLNMSKRTLYEIFGDRENLIVSAIAYYNDCHRRKHELCKVHSQNMIELFMALLIDWKETGQKNIAFMNDLRRFYPSVYNKVFAANYEEGMAQLKEHLEQGIRDGVFLPYLNVEFSAYMLTGSIMNVMMHPSSYQTNNISQAEAFKYILMCFIRGISTNKGIRMIDRFMQEHAEIKLQTGNTE